VEAAGQGEGINEKMEIPQELIQILEKGEIE